MSYKRALWTSGYTYRMRCPYCGTEIVYTDRQLGYRSWYPNGFVYCPTCRKPQRHNEIFAIYPDGSPVYTSQEAANQAIVEGYYRAIGAPVPPQSNTAAPAQNAPDPSAAVAFCTECGRRYRPGFDHFCSGCGKRLG